MDILFDKKYYNYFAIALKDSTSELEYVHGYTPYKDPLQKKDFIRLLNVFRQKYRNIEESNTLDINKQVVTLKRTTFNNIRVSIEGIQNIQKYCKTNNIQDIKHVSFIRKSEMVNPFNPDIKLTPLKNYDYNFRMNIKKEENLPKTHMDVEELLDDFDTCNKYYRYKKRYSFVTDDNLFRLDLTALKCNSFDFERKRHLYFKNLIDSNVLANKEQFEFEIEYIGNKQINDKYPIDDFVRKLHDLEIEHKDTAQNNAYSELSYVEPIMEYDHKEWNIEEDGGIVPVSVSDDEGEFDLSEKSDMLFPVVFQPITSNPLEDIHSKYWKDSEREWLFNAMVVCGKNLLYNQILKNTDGDYPNSPSNTDYVQYTIYPHFTEEEIQEIEDFPEDFNNDDEGDGEYNSNYELLIPLLSISGTSETKQKDSSFENIKDDPIPKTPSWAPENQKYETNTAFRKKTNQFHTIEKIVGKRKKEKGITIEYKIRWEGEEPSEDEWKTSGELPDAQKMIQQYNLSDKKGKDNQKWYPEYLDPSIKTEWLKEFGPQYYGWEDNISETMAARKDSKIVLKVASKMESLVRESLETINEYDYIIKQTEKDSLIETYRTLTTQTSKRTNLIGPQPVSMDLDVLLPENPYSILKGYVVTEKADGIRAQLLITNEKIGYLITSRMNIIHTGLRFENISGIWLFDGEYITQNKNGDDIRLFMIFDVYHAADSGKEGTYPNHAYTYPWLSKEKKGISRSSILHDFKINANITPIDNDKDSIRIGYKMYLEGPKTLKQDKKDKTKYTNLTGMGKISRKIWKARDTYEYNIDGLIYLPMYLSVNSMNEGEIQNKIGGTWTINYKWKPEYENSIDFKVKIVKQKTRGGLLRDKITSSTKDGEIFRCKQVQLYVAYNKLDDPKYDYCWEILSDQKKKPQNEQLFLNDSNLATCNIPLSNGKMICQRDKVEIKENMVLEMLYNPDNEEGMNWLPLRHRYDKTSANRFDTAENIWKTIQNPVTEELMQGKGLDTVQDKIQEVVEEKDQHRYYIDTAASIDSDIPLRDFHNYIKSKLISAICSIGNQQISILDTSIGQGGDINKYLRSKNRISFLLGLDISSNIQGAARRFYLSKLQKPKAMFIQYDTGENIQDGSGFKGDKIERNQKLMNILFHNTMKMPKELKEIQSNYKELGKKGFSIISSQFSIHYYFENELKLRSYLKNISDNCKKGGYFIGTCYDGKKIFQALDDQDRIEMKDDFGNKVYSIEKKYTIDDFEYRKDDWSNLFGQEIEVEMSSIGQPIIEYLVNFELLFELMKEYGFQYVVPSLKGKESGIFDNMKYTYNKGFGGFELILKDLRSIASKDKLLRENFSQSLELFKEENEMLRKLTSFNNWFIFQKI